MNTEILNPYEQKRAEAKARLTAFIKPIIPFLHGNWGFLGVNHSDRVYLDQMMVGTTDEKRLRPQIHFTWEDEKEERIIIRYSFDSSIWQKVTTDYIYTNENVKVERPKSITVGKKAPERVAADINRKLLPEIKIFHYFLIKTLLQVEFEEEKRKNCVLRIARATGSKVNSLDRKDKVLHSFYIGNLRKPLRITVSGENSIQLENWTVTETELLKIVEVFEKKNEE